MYGVPSYVGEFVFSILRRHFGDGAGDGAEAMVYTKLVSFGEEDLCAEADAHEGFICCDVIAYGLGEVPVSETLHTCEEGAVAREDACVGCCDGFGVVGDGDVGCVAEECLVEAVEVSDAVVDYGDVGFGHNGDRLPVIVFFAAELGSSFQSDRCQPY